MDTYDDIIKSKDYKKIKELFNSKKPAFSVEQEEAISQYKVAEHDIFDKNKRPDKTIRKDSGENNTDGSPKTIAAQIAVGRIGVPFQKIIVERRVGFMLKIPVEVDPIFSSDTAPQGEKDVVQLVDRIQNDNKMDYKNKEIARRLMSEMECAELWYYVENKQDNMIKKVLGIKGKFTLKVKILSPDLGDTLYPLFDNTGDLIAFSREYKIKEDGKDIEHFDVFTPEFEYKYINKENTWALDVIEGKPNPIPNATSKLMVIYHSQKQPEWTDVQTMISRYETNISNNADMNDYFGSPILAVMGKVLGFAQKGEQGKILELAQESKANYLTLSSSPKSIHDEQETLEKLIHAMSQTPNITFEEMKGLGAISGVALELLFLDAHIAVSNKEEIFGIGLQRRFNLLKACIAKVLDTSLSGAADIVQLKPIITPYLPNNTSELISDIGMAVSSGFMSKETAIEQNPLIEDTETELERVKTDVTTELTK